MNLIEPLARHGRVGHNVIPDGREFPKDALYVRVLLANSIIQMFRGQRHTLVAERTHECRDFLGKHKTQGWPFMESTSAILAIDLGKFHCEYGWYAPASKHGEFGKVSTLPRILGEILLGKPFARVVMEVCSQATWVSDPWPEPGLRAIFACLSGDGIRPW